MHFIFTSELGVPRTDEIVSYLLGPRLWIPRQDYPDFEDWIERVHRDLKQETKRVLVALANNVIVGAIIYQQHKACEFGLEIKNITVRPDQQGRYIASFLLRNAEIEGRRDFQSRVVVCDTKAANEAVRWFLQRHRYRVVNEVDLYGLGVGHDLVFRKELS